MGILADHGINEKRFILGALCKHGHDWNATGLSLRYSSNNRCPICKGTKTPGLGMLRERSPESRFFSRVSQKDGCWLWTGGKTKTGYGNFCLNDRNKLAHRFSYELHHGLIPDGMVVCHSCDNPSCVNPEHLFLGTYQDNTNDMIAKGRIASGEKHSSSKLLDSQRDEIVRLCKLKKWRQKDVAEKFDISPSLVRYVLAKHQFHGNPSPVDFHHPNDPRTGTI